MWREDGQDGGDEVCILYLLAVWCLGWEVGAQHCQSFRITRKPNDQLFMCIALTALYHGLRYTGEFLEVQLIR